MRHHPDAGRLKHSASKSASHSERGSELTVPPAASAYN